MIGVDELLDLILADLKPPPPVDGYLHDAWGQVLAEDLVAVNPLPWFANAAMDGFALRRADLSVFDSVKIVADVAAGTASTPALAPGEGVAVATGAPIPPGLDTVVPLEVANYAAGLVSVHGDIPDHGHVRPAGEDVPAGASIVPRGTVVDDTVILLGHATGVYTARSLPRVRVRLLTVGDELISIGADPIPSRVQNFNNELLMGPIHDCGCSVSGLSSPPDRAAAIAAAFQEEDVDVFVTTGGLGPGRHDVVVDAVASVGTVQAFDVAMRPGKAFAFGRANGKRVYCLPGNPGAALAAFHALVAPALRVLAGRPPHPPPIHAVLTAPLDSPAGRRHYVRATLSWDGPTLAATPTGRQGSGLVSDIAAADAFLVLPEDVERAQPGDVLQILPLKPIGGP